MGQPVEIRLSTLKEQVKQGMKKKELAEHYQISVNAMGNILKQAGLQIRKFHTNKPVLIDDTEIEDALVPEMETVYCEKVEEKTFADEVKERGEFDVDGIDEEIDDFDDFDSTI